MRKRPGKRSVIVADVVALVGAGGAVLVWLSQGWPVLLGTALVLAAALTNLFIYVPWGDPIWRRPLRWPRRRKSD
jgi:hypothetical protein